jgi:hypothetical protein
LLQPVQKEFFAHIKLDENQDGAIQWRRSRRGLHDGSRHHARYLIPAEDYSAENMRESLIVAGVVMEDERAATSNSPGGNSELRVQLLVEDGFALVDCHTAGCRRESNRRANPLGKQRPPAKAVDLCAGGRDGQFPEAGVQDHSER